MKLRLHAQDANLLYMCLRVSYITQAHMCLNVSKFAQHPLMKCSLNRKFLFLTPKWKSASGCGHGSAHREATQLALYRMLNGVFGAQWREPNVIICIYLFIDSKMFKNSSIILKILMCVTVIQRKLFLRVQIWS